MTQLKQQIEDYLNKKKLEEVVEVCQQALQQNSNDLIAYHGLGVALQLKGQLEEAKQWYLKILEQQPNLAEVHVNLGSLYIQQQQPEKAIQAYETALRLQPNLVQAHRNLAKLLYEVGQSDKATEHEYQVLKLNSEGGTAQQYFKVGNQFWQEKKFREAAFCYEQAIEKQSNFLECYYNLAETLVCLQEWDKAEKNYYQALQLNPKFERAYIGLGNILAAKEQWNEAILFYEKAIECNPNYYWSYNHLGNAMLQNKSLESAEKAYQKSIQINPNIAVSYLKLGEILLQQEKWQKSAKAYKKVVELDANSFWGYQGLGRALYHQGKALSQQRKCKESIAAYSKAIQLNPMSAPAYYNLGLSLWQMQQWEDAVAAYIQAIQLQPDESFFVNQLEYILRDSSELSLESILKSNLLKLEHENHLKSATLTKLGKILFRSDHTKAALFLFKLALKIDPKNKKLSQKMKQVQRREKEIGEQIGKAQAVVQKHPQSFEGYRELGAVLLQKNYWHESLEAYLQALVLKPEVSSWYYEREFWNLAQYQNQLDYVIKIYREVITQKPQMVNCHVNLGKALSFQGKIEEAVECYREAGRQTTLARYPDLKSQLNFKLVPVKSPSFIIIGAQKCGTTSLYHYLAQHPRIMLSIVKEIDFWSRDFNRGLEWYLAQFPPRPKGRKILTGEASPSYLNHQYAPERLCKHFSHVKLIVLLRNPVNRAISHYYHWLREEWTSKTLQEAIELDIQKLQEREQNYWSQAEGYVARGAYVKFLKKWMSIFPREQFLILKSEDFYENPAKTLSQVYHFLEIPNRNIEDFKPYNSGSYSSVDPAIMQTLQDYFKPYNQELEDFLGMKFNWE